MEKVDRKNFLALPETRRYAYDDRPLPLNAQVTISAPHMHAMALEYFSEQFQKPGCKCLDVGSGSGYLVSCMLRILKDQHPDEMNNLKEPRVIGVEYLEDMFNHSQQALQRDLSDFEGAENMYKIFHGDGWKGAPDYAPFDVIHVGAAAEHIPKKLVDQLSVGGRMVIPVGPQYATQVSIYCL
jgi:protein-L-isoaspartate(D-aspartate) O-methyltransferase